MPGNIFSLYIEIFYNIQVQVFDYSDNSIKSKLNNPVAAMK